MRVVSGGSLGEGLSPQTLDHGQNFSQNGISIWHLLYTAIHKYHSQNSIYLNAA